MKKNVACFKHFSIKQINNLQSNAPCTEQEQKGPGAALLAIFSPKHSQSEHDEVLTSGPQQSPPSKPQLGTLFSSWHQPVPILAEIGLKQAGIQNETQCIPNCSGMGLSKILRNGQGT